MRKPEKFIVNLIDFMCNQGVNLLYPTLFLSSHGQQKGQSTMVCHFENNL